MATQIKAGFTYDKVIAADDFVTLSLPGFTGNAKTAGQFQAPMVSSNIKHGTSTWTTTTIETPTLVLVMNAQIAANTATSLTVNANAAIRLPASAGDRSLVSLGPCRRAVLMAHEKSWWAGGNGLVA